MRWLLLLLLLLVAPAAAAPSDLDLPVKRFVLKNGLTVLLLERHDAPVFSGYLFVRVGSANERPGITGGSHLLEHMMFKGTKLFGTTDHAAEKPVLDRIDRLAAEMRAEQAKLTTAYGGGSEQKVQQLREQIAKLEADLKKYSVSDELWGLYLRNGGTGLNASTGWDATDYYVSLPSNRFRLWALLESDRLANPVFREFYSERDVVMEERRMRTDTNPGGKLFEDFQAVAYSASPYRDPVVGWPSDLQTMSREDMLAYFKRYYAPNNLVVALVGDLREAEVRKVMEEYFGPIPSQPAPPPVFTADLPHAGERRVEVEMDASPQVYVGYLGPSAGHPDQFALDVMTSVLSMGRTSRLHKNLVETGLALGASAGVFTRRLGNLIILSATPQAPHTAAEVEAALYAEVEKLQQAPPEAWEMEKVINNLEADFVRGLGSDAGLASALAESEAYKGSWRLFDERDRYRAVTPADVQRVARQYFTRQNRTVGTLVPKEDAQP